MTMNLNYSSAFQSGVEGLNRAQRGMSEATTSIAQSPIQTQQQEPSVSTPSVVQSPAEPRSLTEDVVKLAVEKHHALANIKTIETADDMLGSLIDTKV